MLRSVLMYFLLAVLPGSLFSQSLFEELVDHAFGIDQSLVNGIQFSNQYIRINGNPYFLHEGYRVGSVCINDRWYDYVPMRYNLYTQKVEIQYLSREGDMNQLITVPERMSAFILDGYEFHRININQEAPAYYMRISTSRTNCYIGWSLDALGGGSSQRRFSPLKRKYWIQRGEQWLEFDDRKSYVRAFSPERKKEFKNLLRSKKFYFQMAGASEVEDLIAATLLLYERGEEP